MTKTHLAAVLLKQYVKQHWQKDEKNFVEPEVSPEDKVCSHHIFVLSLELWSLSANIRIRCAFLFIIAYTVLTVTGEVHLVSRLSPLSLSHIKIFAIVIISAGFYNNLEIF